MSEFYDHYHRWEPLAEFHFSIDGNQEYFDDNYVYCLCSRAFIRDAVKSHFVEKEEGSESDVEVYRNHIQELEDQSHVHFSVDTSDKVKCEKDEVASCYCSASHTENYCSTDEHDPAQFHVTTSHALQPSDSGADLTYQECHLEFTNHDKIEKMDQITPISETSEDYLSTDTWEKFWSVNGERLIWASWIKNYSDYINPAYLDDNNDLLMDDNNIPKQHSADQIFDPEETNTNLKTIETDDFRERKFSYDSKVNPYKKRMSSLCSGDKMDRSISTTATKDNVFVPIGRRRSCSEHDRMLSPRTLAGTDSMTNVTKITLSSYDVTSSHVTSDSSQTDDYSVSSADDPSNDQTRIANIDDILDPNPSEDLDADNYWQFLWKKHFGEQYALHNANFLEKHSCVNKTLANEKEDKSKVKDENLEQKVSESKPKEITTVSDVQNQVEDMTIEEKVSRPKKRNKKTSSKYLGSVGVLLQSLLKEEQKKSEGSEAFDGNETTGDSESKSDPITTDVVDGVKNTRQPMRNSIYLRDRNYGGDDDPPEEKPVTLKRSHELDEEEEEETDDKIKTTFQTMGFSFNPYRLPKGLIVYRKHNSRLRPPRYKRYSAPRKTYFDDDGNSINLEQEQESQDDEEMQTEDNCPIPTIKLQGKTNETSNAIVNSIYDACNKAETESNKAVTLEAADMPLPDFDASFSDPQENYEYEQKEQTISSTTKRRRRQKRKAAVGVNISDIPEELQGEPKMLKYWKKRHSLFHRFDEGIKLDKESWFSVTPENVAWHIANKCVYDVVIDAFCGAGGNTIQFARTCKKIIAIDIDSAKIEMAKHNASVYGVAHKIEFIAGDFFELAPQLQADMVFLSPPWGGPNYTANDHYDIETMLEPRPASELMAVARKINTNVALYLPRNTKSDQILALAKEAGSSVEVEQSYLDKRFVAITAYYY